MKTRNTFLFIFLFCLLWIFTPNLYSQGCNAWVDKTEFGGTARKGAIGFSLNGYGYIGLGHDGDSLRSDIWRYNPTSNSWSLYTYYPGTAREGAVVFVVGNEAFIGLGEDASSLKKDFWKINSLGQWSPMANFPGTARKDAAAFATTSRGFVGTGSDPADKNDFWEYNPYNNTWTQKANFPGQARINIVGFAVNDKGYFGSGGKSIYVYNEVWEYDPGANSWTRKANLPSSRSWAVGFAIGNKGYLGCGFNKNDFYEYDPENNNWRTRATACSFYLEDAVGFAIGNKGYIGTGLDDSHGYIRVKTFRQYTPEPRFYSSTATNVTCNNYDDGSISIDANGISTLYYSIYNGADYTLGQSLFEYLGGGSYTVKVMDANGCEVTGNSHTITDPPVITITNIVTDSVNCNGQEDGSVTVYASGGTGSRYYTIDGGSINTTGVFTNLAAKEDYIISVTDIHSCPAATGYADVKKPDEITFDGQTATDVTCFNGSDGMISLSAIGGSGTLYYSIDGGNTFPSSSGNFSGLTKGTYNVAVRDYYSCEVDGQPMEISQPPELILTSQEAIDISCNGLNDGTIIITTQGGRLYRYFSIDNGETYHELDSVFDNLGPGTDYIVQVKDNYDCIVTGDTLSIIDPPEIMINSQIATQISCYGLVDGTITLSASGGTAPLYYSINDGVEYQLSGEFTDLYESGYVVHIKDVNDCHILGDTFEILEPPQLQFHTQEAIDISCHGLTDGSINLEASGGTGTIYFSIDSGKILTNTTGIFYDLPAADDYYIFAQDENGCQMEGAILEIIDPPELVIDSVISEDITCYGLTDGKIRIQANGGTGSYLYSITGGFSFEDNNGIFEELGLGSNYIISVKDTNDCQANYYKLIAITQPLPVNISSAVSTDISCSGLTDGIIEITAEGGVGNYRYSVDNGATFTNVSGIFTGLSAGTNYQLAVQDSNECTITGSTLVINDPPPIVIDSEVATDLSCYDGEDGTITVSASGGTGMLEYSIDGGTSYPNSTGSFDNLGKGNTYNIMVRDANECTQAGSTLEILPPAGQEICLATVDIETGKNLVIWERPDNDIHASYNIYREGTDVGEYEFIGNMPYEDLSVFVDTSSNPRQRSYRYKIKAVDQCGDESEFSFFHKTILLRVNLGVGTYNLDWDDYEYEGGGFTFRKFFIYRGTTENNLELIDSIASSYNSYIDTDPPEGLLFYQIAGLKQTPCYPANVKKADSGPYSHSMSNIEDNRLQVGIDPTNGNPYFLKVYPNPVKEKFMLEFENPTGGDIWLEIIDLNGKLIQFTEINSSEVLVKKFIDVSEIPPGVYVLKARLTDRIETKRLIIE